MSSDTEVKHVEAALEVLERAERRASLSAREADTVRQVLLSPHPGEVAPRNAGHPVLSPRGARMIIGLSEGVLYGMISGAALGGMVASVTGSALHLGFGGMAGIVSGAWIAVTREMRSREPGD
ncbi:MAG TPA: hypothetical protein VF665_02460 [Longimicrobium sp.]|jgi:hypothetical protein|uniref:hypothetical protein n=1 Tax=Longimicrobium sp. TaxID=2029185 RepID=UPI002EDA07EE